jgi:tetratricopeptide (TPR) repeat protein
MKSFRLSIFITLSVLCGFLLSSRVLAYTSSDYYNAGLQLYNAKNYQQAAQYFGAAISLDPNNTAALQGQANSYYALGQYQQALDDYQKVQALQSSPQLASMIQNLQAKVGAGASATAPPLPGSIAAPPAPGAPTGDSFAQGVALFQQQQYAQAVPLFQKATQENPNDSKAYYYLGVAQIQSGDMKDAAVALGLSNKINPNPSVAAYVDRVKGRLSPEDQQWVDNQIASGNAGGTQSASASKSKTFGIRLEPALVMLSLADFTTNAESQKNEALQIQPNDPSISYNGAVPTGAARVGAEPVLKLSPNFEIGVPWAIIPVGTASDALQDSNGVTITDSYNISAIAIGLNVRYLFGSGSFQPYIAGGPLVVPINIGYSAAATTPSPDPTFPSYTSSGNFTGVAVGGQASLGLDWHLGDTFVVTPFAGYQFASANSFQATVNSNSGASSGQTATLEVIPTSFGSVITPVSNGKLILPVANGNQVPLQVGSDAPAGSRPLEMDLSGPFGGIQLSAFF